MAEKSLSEMTRPELDARAESLGIANASEMKNADEVRAAIRAAEAGTPEVTTDTPDVVTNGAVGSLPPADDGADDGGALDSIQEGGVFIVGGKKVDAFGREVK